MIRNKGLSLVELIVSAGIVGGSLSALLMFFSNSVVLNENARNMTVAITHAEFVLEEVRDTALATAVTRIDSNYWTWPSATSIGSKGLSPLKGEVIVTTRTNTAPYEVTVNVAWQDTHQRQRLLSFVTIIGGA